MNLGISGLNNSSYGSVNNQSPSFGMAIRFTPDAMTILKRKFAQCGDDIDVFVKQIKPAIKKAENNPIHVIVDKTDNAESNLLKAVVEDRKIDKENFGFDASKVYTQSNENDYRFISDAVDNAEIINQVNKKLKDLPQEIKPE